MSDREKVIKGLGCCTKGNTCSSDCPYFNEVPITDGKCITALQADALALMKEQKPVKPTRSEGTTWFYKCGICGIPIDPRDAYCRECGRAIDWS